VRDCVSSAHWHAMLSTERGKQSILIPVCQKAEHLLQTCGSMQLSSCQPLGLKQRQQPLARQHRMNQRRQHASCSSTGSQVSTCVCSDFANGKLHSSRSLSGRTLIADGSGYWWDFSSGTEVSGDPTPSLIIPAVPEELVQRHGLMPVPPHKVTRLRFYSWWA
jgi:hypothetical protein